MKIAVLASGLIRGNQPDELQRIHETFPTENVDFFNFTWTRKWNESEFSAKQVGPSILSKSPHRQSVVNKYFDQPPANFSANKRMLKDYILTLRKMQETNWDRRYLPDSVNKPGRSLEEIKKALMHPLSSIKVARHQHKQHVAHALACKEIDHTKYDLIVRARYDTVVNRKLRSQVQTLAEMCMDTHMPVGFNHLSHYGINTMTDGGQRVFFHPSCDIHDFMIFHRADMFDPEYVFDLRDKKQIMISEAGWWQILGQPYDTYSWEARGYVKLHSQHVDEHKYLEYLRNSKDSSLRNTYKEKMNSMVGNVASKIRKDYNPDEDMK